MSGIEIERQNILHQLRGGLIVSCQAAPDSPMDCPEILAGFAKCAVLAGAVAIRANHGKNISAIRQAVTIPIIGLKKRDIAHSEVYITPEWQDVVEVVDAGANIVAVDATLRARPVSFAQLIARIREEYPKLLVMADCATLEDGLAAAEAGADIIGTTMSGYTFETETLNMNGPDFNLISELRRYAPSAFLVCEGRIHLPEHVTQAYEAGASAVVVGTAITAPQWITQQFVRAAP